MKFSLLLLLVSLGLASCHRAGYALLPRPAALLTLAPPAPQPTPLAPEPAPPRPLATRLLARRVRRLSLAAASAPAARLAGFRQRAVGRQPARPRPAAGLGRPAAAVQEWNENTLFKIGCVVALLLSIGLIALGISLFGSVGGTIGGIALALLGGSALVLSAYLSLYAFSGPINYR